MSRKYTKRGAWIEPHGNEVIRLWRDTNMPAREIGALFGISKGAVTGFVYRQKDCILRSYITPSVKAYAKRPATGLNLHDVEGDITEISKYRHDTKRLVSCAARISGMPVEVFTSEGRKGAKKKWRAMYVMRKIGLSYPRIGQLIGRDHTTVQHGVKRFKATLDAALAAQDMVELALSSTPINEEAA